MDVMMGGAKHRGCPHRAHTCRSIGQKSRPRVRRAHAVGGGDCHCAAAGVGRQHAQQPIGDAREPCRDNLHDLHVVGAVHERLPRGAPALDRGTGRGHHRSTQPSVRIGDERALQGVGYLPGWHTRHHVQCGRGRSPRQPGSDPRRHDCRHRPNPGTYADGGPDESTDTSAQRPVDARPDRTADIPANSAARPVAPRCDPGTGPAGCSGIRKLTARRLRPGEPTITSVRTGEPCF